jgi:hypothetical protein
MTKKEFQEMVAISAALDNKYDAVLVELSIALGFTYTSASPKVCAPEEFPDKGDLIDYIESKITTPVGEIFVCVAEIDERELDIAVVLKYWEDEASNSAYTEKITIVNSLKKVEVKIDIPSGSFLKYVISVLTETKGPITFKETCKKIKGAATSFYNNLDNYVDVLEADKKIWRQYYKKESKFHLPPILGLYEKIRDHYADKYVLTENDYKEGIERWLREVQTEMKSIKAFDKENANPGLEAVSIEKKKFEKLLKKQFNDLGSAYPVYAELNKNFFVFLQGFKKPFVLGSLDKYIEKEGNKIKIPAYSYETYKNIKDDSAIYDVLRTVSIKDDVLLKALDETDPIYYDQDPVLSKKFEGFKTSIDESIKEWKNDIVTAIAGVTKSGLPEVEKIKSDLRQACIGYPKDVCDQLLSLIDLGFGSAGNYNSEQLLSKVKEVLMTKTIIPKDIDALARKWWTESDATLNADSSFTQKDLLPHQITIAAAFDENIISGISPQVFDRSVRAWRDDVRAAISLIAIDFPEGSTVVGKDLLEHLNPYFENALLERLWTQMKSALPKAGDIIKIEVLQTKWLAAIADANWESTVLASKGEGSDGVGLLFLDFYADKNNIQAFCASAYILLPSKEEISLAVKNAVKKRPVVSRSIKRIKQLEDNVSILSLKDDYFVLRNAIVDGYRSITEETNLWLTSVENVSLEYVKAHKMYAESVVSCNKSAKKQADHANMVMSTVLIGTGVVAAFFAIPCATGALFAAPIAAGPIGGFVGGTVAKALGSSLMDSAKKLTDSSQTEFEFYLQLKLSFPKGITDLKNLIEENIQNIDDKIQYLKENSSDGAIEFKDLNFNLEKEKVRFNNGVQGANDFMTYLSSAVTVLKEGTAGLKPKADADNILERNLYRIFISSNFKADSYGYGISTTDWDVLCGAEYFKSRLVEFGLLTSDDFIDNTFGNSDDDNDMKKLFKFANSEAEVYLQ